MKKLFCAILLLTMLLSVMGCAATNPGGSIPQQTQPSQGTQSTQPTVPVETAPPVPEDLTFVEVSDGQQLKLALEAGSNVKLASSFDADNAVHGARIEGKKNIYFDLNGCTLTVAMTADAHMFNLLSSSLTVFDSSAKKNGCIRAIYNGFDCALFRVNGENLHSELTVMDGKYLYRSNSVVGSPAAAYLIHSNGDVVIWGGSYESSVSDGIFGYAGTLAINGGTYRRAPKLKDPCVLTIGGGKALLDTNGDSWLELHRDNDTVAKPLTLADLEAIPVADSSMTEAQLRQVVVDFMRLQLSFAWTPSRDFTYKTGGSNRTLYSGTVYAGLPYISSTGGNLYNALHLYNSATGTLDTTNGAGDLHKIIGNQCSGSAFWAWARISNSMTWGGTPNMLERNGALRLGNYTYDDNIQNFHEEGIRTSSICSDNGQQVMYESYALLKMADGIVMYVETAGHVRMIAGDAVVVRNASGEIDGEKSYIVYLDQRSSWTDSTQENGQPIHIQGGIDKKMSFKAMYAEGYLPFRVPELAGKDPVEKATASIGHTDSSITLTELYKKNLTANYPLSDVTVTVVNDKGEVLYEKTAFTMNISTRQMQLRTTVLSTALRDITQSGTHTIIISARVGTGEKLVAYEGVLIGK